MNSRWTFQRVQPKRGTEATDGFDVLRHCRGRLNHDRWSPYISYMLTCRKQGSNLCGSIHRPSSTGVPAGARHGRSLMQRR